MVKIGFLVRCREPFLERVLEVASPAPPEATSGYRVLGHCGSESRWHYEELQASPELAPMPDPLDRQRQYASCCLSLRPVEREWKTFRAGHSAIASSTDSNSAWPKVLLATRRPYRTQLLSSQTQGPRSQRSICPKSVGPN